MPGQEAGNWPGPEVIKGSGWMEWRSLLCYSIHHLLRYWQRVLLAERCDGPASSEMLLYMLYGVYTLPLNRIRYMLCCHYTVQKSGRLPTDATKGKPIGDEET